MKMKCRSICIMFPVLDGKISGAFLVAYKMALAVLEKGMELKVVDYSEGVLYKTLKKDGLDFIFFDLEMADWDKGIEENDVVFGFNNDIYTFPFYFRNNPCVYFYDVYPPFWKRFLRPKGVSLPGKRRFIRGMFEKDFFYKSISVMEDKSKDNIKDLFPSISAEYISTIPVSVKISENNKYNYNEGCNLEITYIGRSVGWKIEPLAKLMKDSLSSIAGKIFCFNIVVSDVAHAKKILIDFGIDFDLFNIEFFENLDRDDLEWVIKNKTDIGFAMGTSALEFCSYGVPTVLLDFSEIRFPTDYKYKWIYQVKGFSLGLDLNDPSNSYRLSEGKNFDEILLEFLREPLEISNRCYSHVKKYHSEEINYKRMLDLVIDSRLKSKDMRSYLTLFFYLSQWFRKYILGRKKYER